eukprot:scaffold76831_cov29-Attheya_sp.AAC.1
MELPQTFNMLIAMTEQRQSIPKLPNQQRRRNLRHKVDLDAVDKVILACNGTPIIDAHMNLRLSTPDASASYANQNEEPHYQPVVLFLQYKHSKLDGVTDTDVKVSDMNAAVNLLDKRLQLCENWNGCEWLFLWVSNRTIMKDQSPDPRLLWVGKTELIMHAPLIGRRGLVPAECTRQAEEEDKEDEMET